MVVTLNGKEQEIPAGCTVEGLLAHLNLRPQGIAVEINREIVPRSGFPARTIAEGDTIEVLRMVGGG